MEILFARGCGLNMPAKTGVAYLITPGEKELRGFSTMTDDWLPLLDRLTSEGCTHVAIESTGVHWKPVFNIFEGSMNIMLVNARDAKGYKARKTDVISVEQCDVGDASANPTLE